MDAPLKKTGSHNHGTEKDGNHRIPYGRDNSIMDFSRNKERAGSHGGGTTNVGHSINGASAHMTSKGSK